ncbi:MAG: multiheme c-type cytochrome, partial [Candidatus Latescibacteria bacterium]|nr:multiheme c-type cytochrome [Candidatus Latescibacterota bacterium]
MARLHVVVLMLVLCAGLLGIPATDARAQSADATYVGSDRCLMCHSAGSLDKSGWKETLHANIYREPTVDTVIGDFTSDPVELSVGAATLTVSFDDGGGSGPWSMRLQGTGFEETYTVMRAHGGLAVEDNEDPVLPDAPGRRVYIGKQRYHTKIGNSYYILPAQWNPFSDRDGKNQGWVNYHASDWMDESGSLVLATKASEERRCMGCHQVGDGPTVNADGEYVLEEADNPSFWNIGCESCHGPGSEHSDAPSASNIVDPKDLTVLGQNEVCGACHIRPTGHAIPDGDASPGYPYSDLLARTYRPGETLSDFIVKDNGGYWPDGTSKKHHQQYPDFQKSGHFTKANMSCISCHTSHNETDAEHDLVKTARDNSVCVQCHASYADEAALEAHSKHEVDLDNGLGRCVDCHMPGVQKSGVNYDIHAHTFEAISPQATLDTQADGGTPNSCAVSCHADGLLGAPTFAIAGGTVGTWNESADVELAKRLLQPGGDQVAMATPKYRAVVKATVTNAGSPVAGVELAFARSIAGKRAEYRWRGTTDASGEVEIEIVVDRERFLKKGAGGYYLAQATDAETGALVGQWGSVPIQAAKETELVLPVGERAQIESREMLTFALSPNSPNPFNPATQIAYQIAEEGEVSL